MRKIDLDFLMRGFSNPTKDQVLLHALCELKGLSFKACMDGQSAETISAKAQPLYSLCGVDHPATTDYGTCSDSLRSTTAFLINRGDFTESELEDKVFILMRTVYSDPGYIESMGPFF